MHVSASRRVFCCSQAVVVLDIEGTTTPISFVADVLFPYAKRHVGAHLRETYDTPETQDDIRLLRKQVRLRIVFFTVLLFTAVIGGTRSLAAICY